MQLASKLDQLEKRFDELTHQMADPAIISDADQYRKVTKAQSELSDIVAKYREWKKVHSDLEGAHRILHAGYRSTLAQEPTRTVVPFRQSFICWH